MKKSFTHREADAARSASAIPTTLSVAMSQRRLAAPPPHNLVPLETFIAWAALRHRPHVAGQTSGGRCVNRRSDGDLSPKATCCGYDIEATELEVREAAGSRFTSFWTGHPDLHHKNTFHTPAQDKRTLHCIRNTFHIRPAFDHSQVRVRVIVAEENRKTRLLTTSHLALCLQRRANKNQTHTHPPSNN